MKEEVFSLPMVDNDGELTEIGEFAKENGIENWPKWQVSILFYCTKKGDIRAGIDLLAMPELQLGKSSNVGEFIREENIFMRTHNQLLEALYSYNKLIKLEKNQQAEVCLFHGISYELVQEYEAYRKTMRQSFAELIKANFDKGFNYGQDTPEILHRALLISDVKSITHRDPKAKSDFLEAGNKLLFEITKYDNIAFRHIDGENYYFGVGTDDINELMEWLPAAFTSTKTSRLVRVAIPEVRSERDYQKVDTEVTIMGSSVVIDSHSEMVDPIGEFFELAELVRKTVREGKAKLKTLPNEVGICFITLSSTQGLNPDNLVFNGKDYSYTIEDMEKLAVDVDDYVNNFEKEKQKLYQKCLDAGVPADKLEGESRQSLRYILRDAESDYEQIRDDNWSRIETEVNPKREKLGLSLWQEYCNGMIAVIDGPVKYTKVMLIPREPAEDMMTVDELVKQTDELVANIENLTKDYQEDSK